MNIVNPVREKPFFLTLFILFFVSCGTPTTRIHEKQRTPSAIKISQLNVKNKTLNLRFEYRSNIEKSLENVDCDITFMLGAQLKLNKVFTMKVDIFSTEILVFDEIDINNSELITRAKSLSYSLKCKLDYDKGSEWIFTESVLYLVPSSTFLYR